MKIARLIINNFRYHRRNHISVIVAAAVAAAVLTGALLVGDSVRFSLRQTALARLGQTQLALQTNNRFFHADLANDIAAESNTTAAAVLQLRCLTINNEKDLRCFNVNLFGVDENFWKIGNTDNPFAAARDHLVINQQLAQFLDIQPGREILLRMEKPQLLARDAPMSLDRDFATPARLTVEKIITDRQFGRFSFHANQVAPFNAFVPLAWLQQKTELPQKANLILLANTNQQPISLSSAQQALQKNLTLADTALQLRQLPDQHQFEIRSERIFIEPALVTALQKSFPDATGVFTYFVNEISLTAHPSTPGTPYSTVAALGPLTPQPTGSTQPFSLGIIPADMPDDEIIINQWLADDLSANVGDNITLKFLVMSPARQFVEKTSTFRLRKILPMTAPALDPDLMPNFPGLAKMKSCSDWDPGIDIDLNKIRPQDEAYWDSYRGSPKAFITLTAGQKLWQNRFGSLTAVRLPDHTSGLSPDRNQSPQQIENRLIQNLDPTSLGLFFQPVRDQALQAQQQAMDFGQLFLSLSFFLIVAALVLMTLIFVFGVEQRRSELATLLALGFTPRRVRKLLLAEGLIQAVLGTAAGIALSILYTKSLILALDTVWQGALGGSTITFHLQFNTLLIAAASSIIIATLAIWLTLHRQLSQSIPRLLDPAIEAAQPSKFTRKNHCRLALAVAFTTLTAAIIILILASLKSATSAAGAFFAAGSLLLIAALAFNSFLLYHLANTAGSRTLSSLAQLSLRNTTRRRSRSLAVIILLACSSFMVFAVGANRHNAQTDALRRDSGTGGFAFIADSTIPILHDLNTPSGRAALGLSDSFPTEVSLVQFRQLFGDDASCLNLNRAQNPTQLGVNPQQLSTRHAFAFAKLLDNTFPENPWLLLDQPQPDGAIPAITDQSSIQWILRKKLGDTLTYQNQNGQSFKIRLVAGLKNSILQGSLLISEKNFIDHYPSITGYQKFLIDIPTTSQPPTSPEAPSPSHTYAKPLTPAQIAQQLSHAGRDHGLQLTPTTQRLAQLFAVENTYLEIFQILGALGMLLGTVALALVLLRNVLERRYELAALVALGFTKKSLARLLFLEHWWLLALGIISGLAAAIPAVWPTIASAGSELPYLTLILTLLALTFLPLIWLRLAIKFALAGQLLEPLRNE
ncbi:MAG: ABC transporter permease [Sedimentisphaerales bacterium]|nr:ABC transporter permease [Sedimentisphaerales bacterium]